MAKAPKFNTPQHVPHASGWQPAPDDERTDPTPGRRGRLSDTRPDEFRYHSADRHLSDAELARFEQILNRPHGGTAADAYAHGAGADKDSTYRRPRR